MKKSFLGIVCLLYVCIISYVWITGGIKNYLAPQLQVYLKISLIPLFLMAIALFTNDSNYKFKVSDFSLLLPIIMLFLAGNGRLSLSFANNRTIKPNTKVVTNEEVTEKKETEKETIEEKEIVEKTKEEIVENPEYDFSNVDFDIVDENYSSLVSYFTFMSKAKDYDGKLIRIKGLVNKKEYGVPKGHFMIGKFIISCCAADSVFGGVIVKSDDNSKFKNNQWYEIEGVIRKRNSDTEYVTYIEVVNYKKINGNKEEQYVYPCYSYGDGDCIEVTKYNLMY